MVTFRDAKKEDVKLVYDFIKHIAKYEHMEDEVICDEQILTNSIFLNNNANVFFIMEDNKEVGFALYYYNFSTFIGRSGLYLEDIYILQNYRGKGYGKAALKHLAKIALDNNCQRMEWCCLDWNQPSIDFYHSIGAKAMDQWTTYRLTTNEMNDLIK